MANKSFRYFLKGIELRGESSDPSDNIEGSVWSNSTSNRFKGYIQSAIREFVTADQAQTLTNKTVVVASNTITTAASGNLTSTELNAALSELQTDIDTRATSSALSAHTGASTGVHGVTGSVVGTSDTQTLTNKTIDAAVNTLSNISNSAIAADAAIDASKIANGTVSNAEFQQLDGVTSSVVGVSDTQTLTNKTITGASIQTPVRSDVKQGTKSALTTYASTAANGQLVFATDTKEYLAVKDGVLVDIGGGAGGVGSVDTLMSQTFDKAALTDFTQTGMELVSSPFIQGAFTARLIHQAVSTYSFKQVVSVNPKFRGQLNTLAFSARSSALSANVTVTVTDETNSTTLLSSTFTTGQITAAVFNTASSTTVTVTDRSILNQILAGATITGSGIPTGTTVSSVNSAASTITISQAATATATGVALKVSVLPKTQKYSFAVPASCASLSYTITALAESGLPETYVDDVQIYLSQSAASSYSLTTSTFNATDWTSYTPTFTGFGTPTSVEFEWRQVGPNYEIRGKAVLGTTTATEARISLPNGATSAGTSIIPSITLVGTMHVAGTFAGQLGVLIEPSVGYITFDSQGGTFNGLSKRNGNDLGSSGTSFSLFASIPISGLTANTTTTNTIPLTSSVLVTQPDSEIKVESANGYGSTNTRIPRFSTIVKTLGSDIQYTDSATLGASFTVLKSGMYQIEGAFASGAGAIIFGASINSTQLTTSIDSINSADRLASSRGGSANDPAVFAKTFYANAGDVIRPHGDASALSTAAYFTWFSISKINSTSILNPSSDQKITIPTHQLRFEGASTRGSTDTAIVKFDTQTITQGDAWTVVNTAANGTVVTIRKAGRLNVYASIDTSGATRAFITKNQSSLTGSPTSSEVIVQGLSDVVSMSGVVDVAIGDVIRVCAIGGSPAADTFASFQLSLQETSVAVALQNVTPTYDNSDSCVRLNTSNGYGSTNTAIRRFSNTLDNLGTAITYADSATLGASFTINQDGIYNISYVDTFSALAYLGLSKNTTQPTTAIHSLSNVSEVLAVSSTAGANNYGEVTWSGFLSKGDVIRPHTDITSPGSVPSRSSFTISRVGKTSGTVDVTPFVQIPVQETQIASAQNTTWASSGGYVGLVIQKNTNNGIFKHDTSNTYSIITALKECRLDFTGLISITGGVSTTFSIEVDGVVTDVANDTIRAGDSGYLIPINFSTYLYPNSTLKIKISSDGSISSSTCDMIILATAQSNSIVSSTQQVSSDTMSFVFKSTAIDPNTDSVGTFNTKRYATASSNSLTLGSTAPSQSASSMNINGIQVFARAGNSTSTDSSPARVEIFLGKGLKSVNTSLYTSAGKTSPASYDFFPITTNERGTRVFYDETTGILTIDAGFTEGGSYTSRQVDSFGNSTSGYFVFNASKSPSLVTVPQLQPRIAYISEQQPSGTNSGYGTASTWNTRVLNTMTDSTGIINNLSSNTITLTAGTYRIDSWATYYVGGVAGHYKLRLRNTTDSTTTLVGSSDYSAAITNTVKSLLSGEITITSTKSFQLQHYFSRSGTDAAGTATSLGENEVYSQIIITKIK